MTIGAPRETIFLASTGVIGEPMPAHKIVGVMQSLYGKPESGLADAARAIMTTDTFPKAATRKARLGGI